MKKKKSENQKQASLSTQQVKEKPSFSVVLDSNFREDYEWWLKTDNRVALKIWNLVNDSVKNPFKGLGEPEPLRYYGSGVWSRKIDKSNRLVYKVNNHQINFLSCRFHYDD